MDRGKAGAWRKKTVLGRRERQGLLQLTVSLLLFFVVFAGQEVFPEKREAWREELRTMLRQDTGFQEVWEGLGEAVWKSVPIYEVLGTFFGQGVVEWERSAQPPEQKYIAKLRMQFPQERDWIKPERPTVPEKSSELPADPVVAAVRQTLGLQESITPVMGVLTSGYGMRKHPIDGVMRMHGGVDIAAEEGTKILAFSDGVVDYIGESEDFGMYLQLRHENDVTTFYAHCSRLNVQKGQKVKVGEVVAEVGNTGVSTGPHLHFEMKKDGAFLDPICFVRYSVA